MAGEVVAAAGEPDTGRDAVLSDAVGASSAGDIVEASPVPPPPPDAPFPAPALPAGTVEESLSFETTSEGSLSPELLNRRICDLGLAIEGRPLGRVVEKLREELRARGIVKLQPAFYLTSEWGVAEGTTAIGIPFYLADQRLLRVQELKGGIVEGTTEEDILRYLRHEMGHVVNYAYRLYETEEWSLLFGPMARPYAELYRAVPFSLDFVRHLPGNYAQKHPDEDWAETFAVWMGMPAAEWRALYEDAPGALRKLEYAERTLAALGDKDPLLVDPSLDEDVSQMQLTLEEFYADPGKDEVTVPRSLDGDLRAIFAAEALNPLAGASSRRGHAASLLRRHRDSLANTVFRWTAVDPAVSRPILDHLVRRARELGLDYPLAARDEVLVQLAGFLTTLAMNYVYKGRFIAT